MAELAREAAAVMRLKLSLRPDAPATDEALVAALEAPDDFTRSQEVDRELFDQLHAIERLAAHRRATSHKGALFQLLLAASAAQHPAGLIRTRLSRVDEMELEQNDRRVNRLHYAAAATFAALEPDDDIAVLRSWYLAPIYDVRWITDRCADDREALIADLRAQAAQDIEMHARV